MTAAVTVQVIREALDQVRDPCSIAAGAPAGLQTMGLVCDVDVQESAAGARVMVKLTVTHPFCMMAAVFLNEARERLGQIAGVSEVEVSLDGTMLWTPERMDPVYRQQLSRRAAH